MSTAPEQSQPQQKPASVTSEQQKNGKKQLLTKKSEPKRSSTPSESNSNNIESNFTVKDNTSILNEKARVDGLMLPSGSQWLFKKPDFKVFWLSDDNDDHDADDDDGGSSSSNNNNNTTTG